MTPLKIKNWKLTLLALIFVGLFTSLGCWQLSRAKQKDILLKSFAERTASAPLSPMQLVNQSADWRFYRVQLTGFFDNNHTLLLDNKTYQGKIGYEVYTPFRAEGLATPILIDRGFIPIGKSRKALPAIEAINGKVTLLGMLNVPPTYVALGQLTESPTLSWPLRIEFVNLAKLTPLLGYTLYPYVLTLMPNDARAYSIQWHAVSMPPEKHKGYAIQWFALALTLLILFFVLNKNEK